MGLIGDVAGAAGGILRGVTGADAPGQGRAGEQMSEEAREYYKAMAELARQQGQVGAREQAWYEENIRPLYEYEIARAYSPEELDRVQGEAAADFTRGQRLSGDVMRARAMRMGIDPADALRMSRGDQVRGAAGRAGAMEGARQSVIARRTGLVGSQMNRPFNAGQLTASAGGMYGQAGAGAGGLAGQQYGREQAGYDRAAGMISSVGQGLGMGMGMGLFRDGGEVRGYAEGGPVDEPRVNPAWFAMPGFGQGYFGASMAGRDTAADPFATDWRALQGQAEQAAAYPGAVPYARGGEIDGPGTGTSDSVPAVVDGQRPAALSDGEFIMTAAATKYWGTKRLQDMNDKAERAMAMAEPEPRLPPMAPPPAPSPSEGYDTGGMVQPQITAPMRSSITRAATREQNTPGGSALRGMGGASMGAGRMGGSVPRSRTDTGGGGAGGLAGLSQIANQPTPRTAGEAGGFSAPDIKLREQDQGVGLSGVMRRGAMTRALSQVGGGGQGVSNSPMTVDEKRGASFGTLQKGDPRQARLKSAHDQNARISPEQLDEMYGRFNPAMLLTRFGRGQMGGDAPWQGGPSQVGAPPGATPRGLELPAAVQPAFEGGADPIRAATPPAFQPYMTRTLGFRRGGEVTPDGPRVVMSVR